VKVSSSACSRVAMVVTAESGLDGLQSAVNIS
jgi:hypothetical protein